ncbi:hypothetical protein RZR45_27430, partial [Klebsiella quasipneumoniae subsp. quasipneumoniae]|nr:hypothetical protein [Klebsiella quasipneumoniae subsp. quasipneumoniae]
SAQIREILISESAWEEMTCLFAPSLAEFYITQDLHPIMLGIFLIEGRMKLSNKPNLLKNKEYKSKKKQQPG